MAAVQSHSKQVVIGKTCKFILTATMKLLCLIIQFLVSQNAEVLVKSDARVDDVTDDYRQEITELKAQNQLMKATMEELALKLLWQGEKLAHQEKEFREELIQQEQKFEEKLSQKGKSLEEQLLRQEEKLAHQEEEIVSLKNAVMTKLDDVIGVTECAVVAENGKLKT